MGNYTKNTDAFYTDLPLIQDVIQLNTSLYTLSLQDVIQDVSYRCSTKNTYLDVEKVVCARMHEKWG